MSDTAASLALEFANNAIEGLDTCELHGIPDEIDGEEGLGAVQRELRLLTAIPEAELARLREVERCALLVANMHINSAQMRHAHAALRTALGATC